MSKKPLIPFSWMPGSWGLKGKTREIAQAEYELSGIELEQRLIEINLKDDPTAYAIHMLDVQKKHNKISDYEYDIEKIKLQTDDDTAKEIALLDVDLANGKISQTVYDRRRADALGEPWVSMPKIHWNPLGKARAYFEMDYNEHFIKQLRENGYEGKETEIVNLWMNDVCISILEEINDMDAEYATPSRRAGGPNPEVE
jgi:hypothetical protein